MKFNAIAAFVFGLAALTASGKELFPESVFRKDAPVEVGDTLAKNPIYVDGPGWVYTGMRVGFSTGGSGPLPMPTVFRAKRVNGVVAFGAATTVNVGRGPSGGWTGDPCGGDTIYKINVVRGMLDRCAVMRFTEIPIAGKKTTVLQAEAIESNKDGRYYKHMIFAVLGNLGLSSESFLKGTPFEPRAMAWLQQFLNATIKAADYDSSASVFSNLESFESLVTLKTISLGSEPKAASEAAQTVGPISGLEEKLLKLKKLFESGLITESEYKDLREKALKEL